MELARTALRRAERGQPLAVALREQRIRDAQQAGRLRQPRGGAVHPALSRSAAARRARLSSTSCSVRSSKARLAAAPW